MGLLCIGAYYNSVQFYQKSVVFGEVYVELLKPGASEIIRCHPCMANPTVARVVRLLQPARKTARRAEVR